MIVHDIFGGELAVAVMELHPLVQLDAPRPAVLGHVRALGQPGIILARLGVDLKEPLERRVMLDHVVSAAIDPRTHVIPIWQDQPHHQTVRLGLAGGGRGLCLGSCYSQKQHRRHREAQHCELPDPSLHHHHTSIAKQSSNRDPPP